MKTNNFFKKIIIITAICALSPTFYFANTRPVIAATTAAEKAANTQQQKMSNLQTRANQEIDRRVSSLNKLAGKIDSVKRLTDEEKTSLKTEISTYLTQLTASKEKITLDTDLTELQNDVKSVTQSYRIYALFMPKINILSTANKAELAAAKLDELSAKLATRIEKAKSEDQETGTLETSLSEMNAKISDARANILNVQDTVILLKPEGYPGNKNDLMASRDLLQETHQILIDAQKDAKTITQELKSFKIQETNQNE